MTDTKEKHREKYVTEDMLEKAFVRFGKSFRMDLRKDVQEIVEVAIDNFAVRFDGMDDRFDKLEHRLDGRLSPFRR